MGLHLNLAALGQESVADALAKANDEAAAIIKEAGYPVV